MRTPEPSSALVPTRRGFARLVRGERGAGKTTALRSAATVFAEEHGGTATVLFIVCVPVTGAQPYESVHELLTSVGECVPATGPPDVAAVVDAVVRTAAAVPLLLLVDDVHHCDPASADLLGVLAARAEGAGFGLVLAAADSPLPSGLKHVPVAAPPPLARDDVRAMAGSRRASPTDTVADELLSLCGGNPLVLTELLATLDDVQLVGLAPLPNEVHLGDRSLLAFVEPVTRLPARTQLWLRLLALGDREFGVAARAARELGLDIGDLSPAERVGILWVDPTGTVAWRSPLVRRAVSQTTTFAERVSVSRALISVTTPWSDPVAHAQWSIDSLDDLTTRDAILDHAITTLSAEGRLAAAYELARRAGAQADPGNSQRERYRVIAAELSWLAGYGQHALDLLRAAGPLTRPDSRASAMALRQVITGFQRSWAPADDPGTETTEAEEVGDAQRARSLGTDLVAGWDNAPARSLVTVVDEFGTVVRRWAQPLRVTTSALTKVITGRTDLIPAEHAALHAIAWWLHPDDAVHPKTWPPPLVPTFLGAEADYARQFTELLDAPHARAARSTRALLLLKLATTQVTTGDWRHALRNAELCRELAAELRLPALESDASTLAALVAAGRGDGDACQAHLTVAYRQEGHEPLGREPAIVQWLQGLLALSQGHVSQARDRLWPLQFSTPSSPRDFAVLRLSTADFVTAAAQSGAWDDARRSVADFDSWVAQGCAPWAELDRARCHALLAGDSAEEWFVKALALLDRVNRLPVSARVELDYGRWLHRRKRYREARPHLRLAAEYFDRLGAGSWHDRAQSELRAAGEADRHDGSTATLTPQELRIARLAADGNSNREIAAALVLSHRTVGYHLHKVFPKLGITSRAQLARALNNAKF